MDEPPPPLSFIVLPVAFVYGAVWPDLHASAVAEAGARGPLAFVLGVVIDHHHVPLFEGLVVHAGAARSGEGVVESAQLLLDFFDPGVPVFFVGHVLLVGTEVGGTLEARLLPPGGLPVLLGLCLVLRRLEMGRRREHLPPPSTLSLGRFTSHRRYNTTTPF